MAFEPARITRETDYFLCKITPEKGLEVLGAYPFTKAEQRRDILQAANTKRLTELRYCIRSIMDTEAQGATGE